MISIQRNQTIKKTINLLDYCLDMKELHYKVKNEYTNIRRENWKDFVDNIQWKKQHKIAIISLHFNNFENTKTLLTYLQQETNKSFDIIIIENSTKEEETEKLKWYIKWKKNIIHIQPIQNIGSAWWYALGMEYTIEQNYEYIFIVEDDVIFTETNTFTDMIQYADEKTLTFIHNCKNTRLSSHPESKGKSRRVQTAWYPSKFIQNIGIIDPRYFFRGEDLEWGWRIETWIKKLWYKTHISNKDYLHPYLKSVNGNYARFYFSIRNQLLSVEKNISKNYTFFITLFLYIWTAMIKWIIHRNTVLLKSCSNAIVDFIKRNYSFKNNTHNIWLFLKDAGQKGKENRINTSKLIEKTQNFYGNTKILSITGIDREKLQYSNNILNIFTHGILISSSSTVFTPLFFLAPKVLCINEFNLKNNTISIQEYKNKHKIKNIIAFVISLVASLITIIIVSIIIILSIGFNRLYKKPC